MSGYALWFSLSRGNETIIPPILYGQGMQWKDTGVETELHLDTGGIFWLPCVKQGRSGCREMGAELRFGWRKGEKC